MPASVFDDAVHGVVEVAKACGSLGVGRHHGPVTVAEGVERLGIEKQVLRWLEPVSYLDIVYAHEVGVLIAKKLNGKFHHFLVIAR